MLSPLGVAAQPNGGGPRLINLLLFRGSSPFRPVDVPLGVSRLLFLRVRLYLEQENRR